MLRVAHHWYGSDVGRQRQGNEDNYFVRSPLFVVADGMGGAQAGEVASELAVEAFRDGLPDGSPIDGLVAKIQQANQRIHDLSRADSRHQGMGTTCTAAYVAEDEVVLAHVGDSRCYLLRDGELTRLTRDHSLVGELVDRGKLTEEQAEVHPQRSVITRALGPEGEVQIDTERIHARSGDLFLLCSDGLTSMVREPDIVAHLSRTEPLADIGRALIAAANDAGGRDNITVVLFGLEEVTVGGRDDQTVEHAAVGDTSPEGQPTTASAPVGDAGDEQEAAYRAQATVAMAAVRPQRTEGAASRAVADRPVSSPPPRTAPPPGRTPQPGRRRTSGPPGSEPRRRSRLRRVATPLAVVLVLLAFVGTAAWIAVRAVFFVGLDANRSVTIYRGLPYELPAGIKLYTRDYTSGVTIDQVPPARRGTFTDHKLRSNSDVQELVRQLETGRLRTGEAPRGAVAQDGTG